MLLILHFVGAPMFHKEHSVVMSVLEREELERQLDCAKTELFTEQRHAGEKLERMQEVLDRTAAIFKAIMTIKNSSNNRILRNIR